MSDWAERMVALGAIKTPEGGLIVTEPDYSLCTDGPDEELVKLMERAASKKGVVAA